MSDPIAHKLKTAFSSFVPATCLDVGANTGQFATEWRKIFPGCEITSIEPNPHCEKGLKKIGVKYLQFGLSDKIGELELIVPKFKLNSKGGSFYKEIKFNSVPDDQILKITVPVTTLDTLFPTKKFDVIKIDVQGAELDVIMSRSLRCGRLQGLCNSLRGWHGSTLRADHIYHPLSACGPFGPKPADYLHRQVAKLCPRWRPEHR